MATKIALANIFIGDLSNPLVLESQVLKRLPLYLHTADLYFVEKIKRLIGIQWKNLKVDKITKLPTIKIHYIKNLGIVNEEQIIENYEME